MGRQWRALEANPQVIQKYCEHLGAPEHVYFADVLSMEDWALEMTPRPVYALLLVYPITPASEKFSKDLQKNTAAECAADPAKAKFMESVWFTKQKVGNACGTVALLHIFGNLKSNLALKSGGYLDNFYQKSTKLSSDERAVALDEDTEIEAAHAAAEGGGQSAHKEEVNEHFVAFVNIEGELVELDGRKKHPILHGPVSSDFLVDVANVVKENYMKVDPEEVRFSMIAVTGVPPDM